MRISTFMKANLHLLLGLQIIFLVSACQTPPPPRVPWLSNPIETPDFVVFAEPGVTSEELTASVDRARSLKRRMARFFFPSFDGERINIILYKNRQSYNRYRRIPLETVADFERLENRINISVYAPPVVWKHELSHAILEAVRGGTPYWLQEGLALFMQTQRLQRSVDCDGKLTARMPPYLHNFLDSLRKRASLAPSGDFDYRDRKDALEFHTALSGYFVLFLWSEKKLTKLLNDYQRAPEATPEHVLTGGNTHVWNRLHEDFRKWLATDAPRGRVVGC